MQHSQKNLHLSGSFLLDIDRIMTGRFFITGFILLFYTCRPQAAYAGDVSGDDLYPVNKHEITFRGSVIPARYAFGYNYSEMNWGNNISGIYESSKYYSKEISTGTWTAAYAYNFSRILALQGSVSYEGGWNKFYNWETHGLAYVSSDNYITLMGTLRVTWLNRKLVRLYSSFGMGAAVEMVRKIESSTSPYWNPVTTNVRFAFQACPIGISVGKKLYGLAEAGIGHQYVGACLGIGYRF